MFARAYTMKLGQDCGCYRRACVRYLVKGAKDLRLFLVYVLGAYDYRTYQKTLNED